MAERLIDRRRESAWSRRLPGRRAVTIPSALPQTSHSPPSILRTRTRRPAKALDLLIAKALLALLNLPGPVFWPVALIYGVVSSAQAFDAFGQLRASRQAADGLGWSLKQAAAHRSDPPRPSMAVTGLGLTGVPWGPPAREPTSWLPATARDACGGYVLIWIAAFVPISRVKRQDTKLHRSVAHDSTLRAHLVGMRLAGGIPMDGRRCTRRGSCTFSRQALFWPSSLAPSTLLTRREGFVIVFNHSFCRRPAHRRCHK